MALRGHDVICLASQAWGSHRCTPQQIAERLGREVRVLYVEPLRSPAVRFSRSATQSRGPGGPPRRVAPNVWALTLPPIFMPLAAYARWPWLAAWNHAWMTRGVRHAAAALGLRDPVVWVYQPTHQGAALLREASLMVYDCIDEWAGATPVPRLQQYLGELDRRLCREADVLFVGSQALAASRVALNPVHALVPQGVDLAHFRAPPPGTPRPDDLARVAGPVLGLVGVLNPERIDVGLLVALARHRRDATVVLVGPVWAGLDVAALEAEPNIRLLGNKPPEQLGRYLAAFDVCLLPYLINDFTRNIFPLKLFEYLASGKPFVATPVPACLEFPQHIRVAEGPAAFLAAVDEALREDDAALRQSRIDLAAENDWDRRTRDKLTLVAARIEARQPQPRPPARADRQHAGA